MDRADIQVDYFKCKKKTNDRVMGDRMKMHADCTHTDRNG